MVDEGTVDMQRRNINSFDHKKERFDPEFYIAFWWVTLSAGIMLCTVTRRLACIWSSGRGTEHLSGVCATCYLAGTKNYMTLPSRRNTMPWRVMMFRDHDVGCSCCLVASDFAVMIMFLVQITDISWSTSSDALSIPTGYLSPPSRHTARR